MANILSSLTKATGKTVGRAASGAAKGALGQFDPRNSIYSLGLGVGPLIKQTVSEYRKRDGTDKAIEESTKSATNDRKEVVKATNNAAKKMSTQLNSISITLNNMYKLQLQQHRAGITAKAKQPISTVTPFATKAGVEEDGGKSALRSGAEVAGMGVGLAFLASFFSKDIGKFVDDFLKGAGVDKKDLQEKAEKVMDDFFDDLETSLKKALESKVKSWLGLNERRDPDTNETKLDYTSLANKNNAGALAGLYAGMKVPGGFWSKAIGGATGLILGRNNPEEAIGVGGALLAGSMAVKAARAQRAAKQAEAARAAAAAQEQRMVDAVAQRMGTPPPGPGVPPTPQPTARPSASLTAEEAMRAQRAQEAVAARQAQMEKEVAEATRQSQLKAQQQRLNTPNPIDVPAYLRKGNQPPITLEQMPGRTPAAPTPTPTATPAGSITAAQKAADAAKTAVDTTKTAVKGLAETGKQVGSTISKYGGKLMGAFGLLVTLPQIIDDVKNGDYAAAGITAATGVASLLATATSVVSGPVGFGLGMGIGIGGDMLANQFRKGPQQATPSGAQPSSPAPTAIPSSSPSGSMPARPSYNAPVKGRTVGFLGEHRGNHLHKGVDIAANKGDPVTALAAGQVVFVGGGGDYGNNVMIKHNDGYTSLYAHLDKVLVKQGQYVEKGTVIGTVGSTGRSEGPHLHLEIRDPQGNWIDPQRLIPSLPEYSGNRITTGLQPYERPELLTGNEKVTPGTSVASTNFSSPVSSSASQSALERMGFNPTEIGSLLSAQEGFRDLMNFPQMITSAMTGEGGGSPSTMPSTSVSSTNAPPQAASSSDGEKMRLMRLNSSAFEMTTMYG